MTDARRSWATRLPAIGRRSIVASLLLVAACGGGGGGESPSTPSPPVASQFSDPTVYSSAATASLSNPTEFTAVSKHQVTIGGQVVNYTATAGHLSALQMGTGSAQASFFYVAYTQDGAAPSTRPVTFFYNGGPGSATVWLHLGSFGPKRLETGVPSQDLPQPFALVDNNESLLDITDLVFVDAVGSGFSEGISPNNNRSFWGVDADAAVFRDFVMRYSIVNNRTSSPKFLYGESYGGPRSGVLADLLEAAGVHLAGVVLQSPAMNYNSNCGITDTPRTSCSGYLPSYSATGAWFGKSNPSPPAAQLAPFMATVRTLASTRYEPALQAYFKTGATDPVLVNDLAAVTGLGVASWQSRFNMDQGYFRVNLVPGSLLGGYDARIAFQTAFPNPNVDPADGLINSSFTARIPEYLQSLGYTSPSTYVMASNAINAWNFSHEGNALPDTIPDLAAAMTQNPKMRVMVVNGYHDLVCPFFVTENDIARLGSNPNVAVHDYPGGHMTYLDGTSRPQMKSDLAAFYRSALGN